MVMPPRVITPFSLRKMKHFELAKSELPAKMLWISALGTAGVILGFSLFELWYFPFSRQLILAVSVFVSVIVCRVMPELEETRIAASAAIN